MKKFEKIKTYKEIKSITITGKKHVLKPFIVYEMKSLNEKLRIGILLSRKFGNAVERNFARRRIIAVFNLIEAEKFKNMVFIPRSLISKMKFEDIVKEMQKIL